jgi:hypothetical protein
MDGGDWKTRLTHLSLACLIQQPFPRVGRATCITYANSPFLVLYITLVRISSSKQLNYKSITDVKMSFGQIVGIIISPNYLTCSKGMC